MRPKSFTYHRPENVDEAVTLLADHDSAELLAGGQSLLPMMNSRLAEPDHLVDISELSRLGSIEERDGGGVTIGAMTTHYQLQTSDLIQSKYPALSEMAEEIGDPMVRNKGTVGGNLSHADPAADYPPLMVALNADFQVQGNQGSRTIEAADFFQGAFETALKPAELLTEIQLEAPATNTGSAFTKTVRRHGDFPLVSVTAFVTTAEDGMCTAADIVLGAVDDHPIRAEDAEAVLQDEQLTEETIAQAADAAQQTSMNPPEDVHASAEYRREMVSTLTERALNQATARIASDAT